MDADIVIASNQLSLVAAELAAAGFTVHEETWSLKAQQTGSDLRIQFTKDPRYQAFLSAAVPAKVLGCDAMVASLRDLVAGKILAWSDPGAPPFETEEGRSRPDPPCGRPPRSSLAAA
jgi:hypothetical protein